MHPIDWRLIFRDDPYKGFPIDHFKLDLQGWNAAPAFFDRIVAELRPVNIFEVGTWKGASTICIADALKRQKIDGRIICIDTWLGALEFWTNEMPDFDRLAALGLRNGYPQVYYQFLANIIISGYQEVVVPLPNTSQMAARFLRRRGVKADLIYIDASHEDADVFADLMAYWELLDPERGLLLGDDYGNLDFPGVRAAVDRFAKNRGLQLTIISGWYWMLRAWTGLVLPELPYSVWASFPSPRQFDDWWTRHDEVPFGAHFGGSV